MSLADDPAREPDVEGVLRAQPLLGGLADTVRELVAASFVAARYEFGEEIVRAGDQPDGFYVIASGRARVVRVERGMEVPLAALGPGDSFGEIGLLEGTPRNATVRASAPTVALRLEPALFGAIVRRYPEVAARMAAQARGRRLAPLLQRHALFAVLSADALGRVAGELREMSVGAGMEVVHEGDPAGPLYLVVDGRLRAASAEVGDIGYLRSGDLFGELSLVTGTPRSATVTAVSDARLAVLEPALLDALEQEHPGLRQRMAERLPVYTHAPVRAVPIDFAEADSVADDHAATDGRQGQAGPTATDGTAAQAAPRGRRQRRHVHHVRQIDEVDCGAACLAMVCRAFGHPVSVIYVRDLVGTSVEGTTLAGLTRGGQALGIDVRPMKVSKDRLDTLPLPAIAHWRGEHWLVVDEVTADQVHVADPATVSHWLPRSEFLQHWTGFTALVSPTPQLTDAPTDRVRLGWLRPFVRPHRWALALVVALALIAAIFQMLVPVVTGEIIDTVTESDAYARVYQLIAGLLALQVAALGASLVQARVAARVAIRIDGESLDHVAGRLLHLPLGYFETRRTGELERRLDGMRLVREFAVGQGVPALSDVSRIGAAVLLMGLLSWPLMLLWLASLPVYLLVLRAGTRLVRPAYEAKEDGFARYRSRRLDAIRGMETVKSMGGEEGLRRRMGRDFDELSQRVVHADRVAITSTGLAQFTTFVLLVLFLFVGALEVMAGNLTVGALVAFNSLVLLAAGPVMDLLTLSDQWQVMAILLTKLRDIIDREGEQTDGGARRAVPSLEGRVTLANVGFGYTGGAPGGVLRGITLDVAPGTTVAIVGRSGSGKSTLLKCVAGLLTVSEGTIAFDGVDVRELRWTELRRRIGLVPQVPYVFEDTVAGNIAFGQTEPDMAAVVAAAEIADAHDFIDRLPLGYATRVGDGGLRLSGGQAQRIAIARAIFHRPPVLLLDEATSALDTEAERAVTENMRRLLEGRTAFVVAHRLSTIRDADLIVVLEGGQLVEMGTHDDLMAHGALYFHLYGQQLADT